ncbi:MAG: hypothetical protein JJE46_06510 [Acidimicrobiia bacterium]|nr:hypothetical protein [Acidimicrobiia bacterium]
MTRRNRLHGRTVMGVAVLALLLTACYRPLAVAHQANHPDTRPWWCHSTGGEGTHGSAYYTNLGITKGMLSWDDCLAVSGHLDKAAAFALQWPTRGDAEAAGWKATVNYATGMGTHHSRGNALQGAFNPDQPNFLQYGGNSPDAKLVGMSWYVNNGPDGPPEGFEGNNDWWHTHEYLCVSRTSGLVVFDGQCPSGVDGTSVYLGGYWMVHAWIVPGWLNQSDVFVGHHPCLLAGGPAAPDDPCWTSGPMPH